MKKSIIPIVAFAVVAVLGAYLYLKTSASNQIPDIFTQIDTHTGVTKSKATDDVAVDTNTKMGETGKSQNLNLDDLKLDISKISTEDTSKSKKGNAIAETKSKAVGQEKEKNIDTAQLDSLRSEIQSLNKVVLAQGSSIKVLEDKITKITNELEKKLQEKPKPVENAGVLVPLTPTEKAYALKILPDLPQEIVPHDYALTKEAVHKALQEGGVSAVLESFKLLSAQGVDVYLSVGNPAPRERPIWLEIHENSGITLLAKNLPYEAYKNLHNRSELPALFQLPAYMLKYGKDKRLNIFRACAPLLLQNY